MCFACVIKLLKSKYLKGGFSKRAIFTNKRVKMKNNRVSMSSIAGKQNVIRFAMKIHSEQLSGKVSTKLKKQLR